MRVLIAGLGYVGLPLAKRLARDGHEVFGITRNAGRIDELQADGIRPVVADLTMRRTLSLPANIDWVANLVSSSKGDAEDYRRVYLEGTLNLIDALRERGVTKFLQASSTSVYAQDNGEEVSEQSATQPDTATSKILVEMERAVIDAARSGIAPGIVLRISGIYGPGRGHLFRQFATAEARLTGKVDRHLNMVHQDDVVGAFRAAFERGTVGEIYNITDYEPVTQRAFFEYLADVLNRPMPPVDSSDSARKRGITDKRVSNRKARLELNWSLAYPTFREGYAAEIDRVREAIARG